MIKNIILLLTIFLISGCSFKDEEVSTISPKEALNGEGWENIEFASKDDFRKLNVKLFNNVAMIAFNGIAYTKYENGLLKNICYYRDGWLDGECKQHYENGGLKLVEIYVRGLKDGWHEEYYTNGELKQKTLYKDGKKVQTLEYAQSGTDISKTEFDKFVEELSKPKEPNKK